MSEIKVHVVSGTTKRLLTEGKYCPTNILVEASETIPVYTGPYYAIPAADPQVLTTAGQQMAEDFVVQGIPYHVTENQSEGNTVYIGGDF